MNDDSQNPNLNGGIGRLVGTVFGLIFLGIGLTVIGFLWGAPFGQFGSPPLFFRIVGSFIALAFVTMGGATAYGAFTGKVPNAATSRLGATQRENAAASTRPSADSSSREGYSCDRCGAPLTSSADVSPHGDVKCTHCDGWFNIHAK